MSDAELNDVVAEAVRKAMVAHHRQAANRYPSLRWRGRDLRTPRANRVGTSR